MTECPIKNLYPHSINTDRFPLTGHDIICLFFSHWKRYYQVCMDTTVASNTHGFLTFVVLVHHANETLFSFRTS